MFDPAVFSSDFQRDTEEPESEDQGQERIRRILKRSGRRNELRVERRR